MKKLPPKHLVLQCGVFVAPITIFLSTVILVTRYASCQLKPEQQDYYPRKEFLFIHSNHLHHLILIIRFLGFKVTQDSIEESWNRAGGQGTGWLEDRLKEIKGQGWEVDEGVVAKNRIHVPDFSSGPKAEPELMDQDLPDVNIELEGGDD